MATQDRDHWDHRYRTADRIDSERPEPPAAFAAFVDAFPTDGRALDVACGAGHGSVWLAQRGLTVTGYDISPIAVGLALERAASLGLSERCHLVVADLDNGLPAGELVDVVMCHMFRDAKLDVDMLERLKPGGLLAVAALSEVGAAPGLFRAAAGELRSAFGHLETIEQGESDGIAWFLGR